MTRRRFLRFAVAACFAPVAPAAFSAEDDQKKRKPDLGDAAEGTYFGDVISDSKGSSKTDVTLTVTRIGPNRVRVTSDYGRLPTIEIGLERVMGKILARGGNHTFLLDRQKDTTKLDVSFNNEVSWSGTKR